MLAMSVVVLAAQGCAVQPSQPGAPQANDAGQQPAAGAGAAQDPSAAAEKTEDAVVAAAREAFAAALDAMEAGRWADAERRLRRLVSRYPDLSGAYANLGIACARQDKFKAAERAYNKAIELNPQSSAIHNHLGILYRRMGEFERAREAYAQALELDPDYTYAHLNLGILYDVYLRDYQQALEHYRSYQRQSKAQDEQVSMWIADIQRRTSQGQ